MSQPIRVLVADDEPTSRLLMQAALQKAGFEVALAVDGEDVLCQFRANRCDIVILDVEMPGLNGYQACTALRVEAGYELPIVMVTGMDDIDSIERAYESGATDFMSKPINWSLIGHRLRYLFRSYEVLLDLRIANARNAAILNAIPDIFFRLDRNGNVLARRGDTQIGGTTNIPGPGTQLSASYPPQIAALILDAASCALGSHAVQNIDFSVRGNAEAERYFEARIAAIDDKEVLCLIRDVTEQKHAEAALRHSEQLMRHAQSVARLGSWHLDLDTNVLSWSPEVYRIFGVSDTTPLTYETFLGCVHPDDLGAVNHAWQEALTGRPYCIEHRIVVDNQIRWVLEQAELQFDERGHLSRGVGTVQDVTERKLQELQIVAAQDKLRATLNAIPDLMFEIDIDGRFRDYHSPRDDLLAAPPEAFLGKTMVEVLPANVAAVGMSALKEANEEGHSTGKQFQLDLPKGKRWFELSVARKTASLGEKPVFITLSRDITERKEAEASIYRLAYFDSLTGLPNRASFLDRLGRDVRRAEHHGEKLAVLFLDMDGFKNINDTLGHVTGDLVLQWVADRLRLALRPSDMVARRDLVDAEAELARLGGDEFTILIPRLTHSEDALVVAHRIRELMHRPFKLEDREVVLTTSIGIAVYPDDGVDAATLLKHADTAMYHAKGEGRDNCQFYSASLTQQAMRRLNMDTSLRLALERGEFFLAYQPQFDTATGSIHSAEALIRWRHPEQGLISPAAFIPLAEENGLIVSIGEWVLRTACQEAARWQACGSPLRVAVNLSPLQFKSPYLLGTIRQVLAETGLAPELLELEVTEGALMEDSDTTLATLHALRGEGMQIALDDFGTGHSSLSYLKRLPLNKLKVDQSFVRGLPDDKDSLAIVKAIVSLAKNLGFAVTPEGVETLDQARILQQLACETLQGYYFSKPIPGSEIPAILDRRWSIGESVMASRRVGERAERMVGS